MSPQGQIGLQVRLLIFMAETDACDRVCILLPYPYSREYLQFVLPSRLFSLGLEYFFQMSADVLLKRFVNPPLWTMMLFTLIRYMYNSNNKLLEHNSFKKQKYAV